MSDSNNCSRSDFFKGAGVLAGVSVLSAGRAQAAEEKQVSGAPLRRLGKTDLMIPAVSLGTGPGQEVNVIRSAIAQGMNFLHTSTGYKGGRAISNVAEAIKGQREKAILGLKITWEPDDDKAMDEALATLGVDSVEIAFFNIHKAAEVRDPKYRAGAERWKKAGRFKYIGLTSHNETAECLKAGLDQGFYDALMPSYSINDEETFLPVFERAEKEGVGIVLMKTGRGVQGAYEESVPHYLATAGVTTINKGASSFAEIRQLVKASQGTADPEVGMRLRASARLAMSGHCGMCGTCTASCPKGLQVSDVVRCSDYYLEHAQYVDMAFETYRGLARTPVSALCSGCDACERACPNGVPVVHHIRRAERSLA